MSITSISQAPGFDQQTYDTLVNQAKQHNIDQTSLDKVLAATLNKNVSLTEVVDLVSDAIPMLTAPKSSTGSLAGLASAPSFGASIMAFINEMAAKQRQENRDLMWQQTEAVAKSMEAQADKMRDAAVTQLVCGVVAGTVSIGAGIAQGCAAGGVGKFGSLKTSTGASVDGMGQATIGQGIGTAGSGLSQIISSVGQYVSATTEADVKEMDAAQQRMQAMRDQLKSLNESWSQTISQGLSAMKDISDSTNQARTKIMA